MSNILEVPYIRRLTPDESALCISLMEAVWQTFRPRIETARFNLDHARKALWAAEDALRRDGEYNAARARLFRPDPAEPPLTEAEIEPLKAAIVERRKHLDSAKEVESLVREQMDNLQTALVQAQVEAAYIAGGLSVLRAALGAQPHPGSVVAAVLDQMLSDDHAA